jgi:hypothetical protein
MGVVGGVALRLGLGEASEAAARGDGVATTTPDVAEACSAGGAGAGREQPRLLSAISKARVRQRSL